MNSRKRIKEYIRRYNIPKLTKEQDKQVRSFFRSKGFKLKHTDWHAFYTSKSGKFHLEYIPRGFFKTKISPKFNQTLQWPALLDKNLAYRIFKGFEQPKLIVQNLNGFFYVNQKLVNLSEAVEEINQQNTRLIIKPSLESGGGRMVTAFTVEKNKTSHKGLSIEELLKLYKKDFLVQEFIESSNEMKALNPTSLNGLRIVSYLNEDDVQILSVNMRIGGKDSFTDNYSTGGMLCGIDKTGKLKANGFTKDGNVFTESTTGIKLEGYQVPNYNLILSMVKDMHNRIPYFRIVSWDIGLNIKNKPVLIEFNTYNQGFEQQMCNGPLFGDFFDEILGAALSHRNP